MILAKMAQFRIDRNEDKSNIKTKEHISGRERNTHRLKQMDEVIDIIGGEHKSQ